MLQPWKEKEDFYVIHGTEKIFLIVAVQNCHTPIPTVHVLNAMVRPSHELLSIDTGKMPLWH